MSRPLLALTIHQPWAMLLVAGVKPVENREWAPPRGQLAPGEYFAIHAGKKWGVEERGNLAELHARGLIPGLSLEEAFDDAERHLGHVLGVVRLDRVQEGREDSDPIWRADSRFGWWVDRPFAATQPITCQGRQKLWRLPVVVAEELRRQWAKANREEAA